MKYVFAFLFFSFFFTFANGQSCNKWGIEICEAPQQVAGDPGPQTGCSDDCFRGYYRVYLVQAGNQTSTTDVPISFTSLILTGNLGVIPANNPLSEVNIQQSVSCSPTYPGLNVPGVPSTPLLTYTSASNAIAYEVSSGNGAGSAINWLVPGRTLLFVLAVDVYSGETVTPNNFSCFINLANPALLCNLNVNEGCGATAGLSKTIALPSTEVNALYISQWCSNVTDRDTRGAANSGLSEQKSSTSLVVRQQYQ